MQILAALGNGKSWRRSEISEIKSDRIKFAILGVLNSRDVRALILEYRKSTSAEHVPFGGRASRSFDQLVPLLGTIARRAFAEL